ncbi:hypothetical protein [Kineococcus rhizosphaerae]|uniref:Uncharacterized protein n=1 Tax=Kineococcus rhizosphaerae TaxID=559628 RepID=A0A2T0QQ01_9ACTN|nr:hypothetical protein [Kineococcus rhizosphaerae]PRY06853.1 hypothetical protein CLV37_1313 [Kineococcus rhizosphaerae]
MSTLPLTTLTELTGWVCDGASATDLRVVVGTGPDGSARVWGCDFDGFATHDEVRKVLADRGLDVEGDFAAVASTPTWGRPGFTFTVAR